MADQVSSNVTQNLIAAAEASGWPVPDLAAHGLDSARLRAAGGWIRWSEYIRLLEVLGGPGADGPRHAELGAAVMAYSQTIPFGRLGQLVSGADALYQLTYGWILNATIKVLRASVEHVAPRHVRVRMTLDPDVAPGEVFFWSASGTMRRIPRMLGLGDAHVEPHIEGHAATYDVYLPPSLTLLARLRRAWGSFVGGDGMDEAVRITREHLVSMMEELRETNARLADAEARWRGVTTRLPGIVAIVRADGTIEALHGAARFAPGAGPGSPVLSAVAPDDRAMAETVLARCVTEGVQVEAELRTLELDGATRWWACRAQPMEGDRARILVVAIEVTEQRRAEAALRESERRYMRAQGMEAIGRLAGGLAHDINNVLATVKGHAELLTELPGAPPDVADSAGRILTAAERAAALTRRVLASSRPRVDAPAVVDLNALLRDAVGLLHRLIGEDVTLVLSAHPRPLPILVDATGVERVVLNLAVNARDALPGGGRVTLTTRVERDRAVLVVSDDGAGMSPEVRARAFEPFFTTKPVGVGTGLGLTTVREILREADGTVEIESVEGEGTSVICAWPLADRPVPPPEPAAPRRPVRGAGEHLLLVEDQEEVRRTVNAMLARLGYQVTPFASGAEALAWLDGGHAIDALVTDLLMPGMSGTELAWTLRARSPELPILLVSGFTAEDPNAAGDLGPRHAFLRKPFGMVELSEALRGVLGRNTD